MTFAIYLLLVTALLMVVGGIPVTGGDITLLFNSPIFILIGFLLAFSSFLACFKVKFSKGKMAFYLNHLSVVLIIIGVFLSHFLEKKGEFNPPLGKDYVIYQIPQPVTHEGMRPVYHDINLGFGISFCDFKISYFPPSYALFRPNKKNDYDFIESAKVKDGKLVFSSGRTILEKDLINNFTKEWKDQVIQKDGSILQVQGLMEREYQVTATIFDNDRKVLKEQMVKINYPIDYKGWRFYLMSYDRQGRQTITVLAKNDPGIPYVTLGLWMLILGVFSYSMTQLFVEVKQDYAK
jgi:cytochrome c biogenesis factor